MSETSPRPSTSPRPESRLGAPRTTSSVVTPEEPSWYVTNGSNVVGPVNTGLLLRGVASGNVPRQFAIARHSWSNWRSQNQIREIRSLRRWQFSKRSVPSIQPVARALRGPQLNASQLQKALSLDHVLGTALQLAISSTRASVGVLHQPKAPFIGLVTSRAHGPGMGLNIGEVISAQDDARLVASKRQVTIGCPQLDPWARSSARRLTSRVEQHICGVALVPIRLGDQTGLLELGRYDHPFRRSDVNALGSLCEQLNSRLQQLHIQAH